MIHGHTVTISGQVYTVVVKGGQYDFNWTEAALLRAADDRLYFGVASGCSCSSFATVVSQADLVPVSTVTEVMQALERKAPDFRVIDRARLRERVREVLA